MLLRMLVLLKILIRHSICDETKRINRNSPLFGNCRMFWPCFIDLQNFILLVRTVPFFFRKIIFIRSYTKKNNYFLLYELIQDLPYVCLFVCLSVCLSVNFFSVKDFSATTWVRILKFGTKLDSDELYCVTKEQPHIAYQSLYLFIFLSLQWKFLSQISQLLLEPVFSNFVYIFRMAKCTV